MRNSKIYILNSTKRYHHLCLFSQTQISKAILLLGGLVVVYKLYFEPRSTVGNFRNFKAPKYNDFWSQYIDMKQLRAERGKYNGKDYSMLVLRKVILYPLEAGAKTIEPFKIDLDA